MKQFWKFLTGQTYSRKRLVAKKFYQEGQTPFPFNSGAYCGTDLIIECYEVKLYRWLRLLSETTQFIYLPQVSKGAEEQ